MRETEQPLVETHLKRDGDGVEKLLMCRYCAEHSSPFISFNPFQKPYYVSISILLMRCQS